MNDLTMVNQLLCPPSLMLEDVGQQRILSSVCHAFRSCLSERCNVHSYQETGHRYVQGCAKLQKQTCMAKNFAIHCTIINFILSLPVIFQISEINFWHSLQMLTMSSDCKWDVYSELVWWPFKRKTELICASELFLVALLLEYWTISAGYEFW